MTKVSTAGVRLTVPVIRQLNLGLFVARLHQKNQGKPTLLAFPAPHLREPQLVTGILQ
uniref:Uncharacterized protein n=1 Tax=uncultured gamma proteobacterium EF100_93H11 TaxID=710976 RepID=E0Y1T4_9GAMM|nr:hypothetical protein [uncultured gamma proteobacterium EF100_93H11]